MSRVDPIEELPFRDFDPADIRRRKSARTLPPSVHQPVPPAPTASQLLAYIQRQYRLGQQRQDRLDRERLRQRREAREREQSS